MSVIYPIIGTVAVLVMWLVHMARKYGNPYKLYMVFGKKGSGKTTLLVKLAIQHMQKGWTVYSTCPVPGAYLIRPDDFGKYEFKGRSVVFIDEVGMIWDNRKFKEFDDRVRDAFKLQRQDKLKVYLFSQTFDVDIKIRTLCDKMYLCQCFGGWLSYAKEIQRKIVVVKPSENAESRIADELIISPLFFFFFGSRIVTYIPNWIPYFATDYMAKQRKLQKKEWPVVPDVYVPTFKDKNVQRKYLFLRRIRWTIADVLEYKRRKITNAKLTYAWRFGRQRDLIKDIL